jgi:hypothetical protein
VLPMPTMSAIQTDAAVPEGHKGLHGFLYGEGGAEEHDAADRAYSLLKVKALGHPRAVEHLSFTRPPPLTHHHSH